MSSHDLYLSPAERAQAIQLSTTLKAVVEVNAGWRPDYVAVRRRADLQAAQ